MKNVQTILFFAAVTAVGATPAHAGEVYGGIGLPGVFIGYAQPLNESFTVRADVATLGSRSADGREEGIDYDGKINLHRAGVFADWFPAQGGFRITGGLTFNDAKVKLTARGDGGTINIGGQDYVFTPADRFDVRVKYPSVTPYLGIGYGHHRTGATGWAFHFDVGASYGKPKVRGGVSGPAAALVRDEDVEQELDELRDSVEKYRVLPQLSVGASYRF